MPSVTVVIPNWNGVQHLAECLSSLQAQTRAPERIVLVDNGSTDESLPFVRASFPDVSVIEMGENLGFSAAVNAGIRAADTAYVALLNNDTAVDPRWVEELTASLDARPDYDMAASLMLLYARDGVVNAAGDVYSVQFLAAYNRGMWYPAERYAQPCRVLGACAGAALYRRSLFDEVGLFDESFFLMHEDTDFNIRALVAGKRCLYVPAARVRHKLGATIDTVPSARMEALQRRNEGIVVGKDLPWELLAIAPLTRLWTLARTTVLVKPSMWRSTPERWRRVRAGARAWNEGLRIGLARRAEVWPARRASRLEILRWLLKGSGPVPERHSQRPE
jgi:GT2 family glycosyltransferase